MSVSPDRLRQIFYDVLRQPESSLGMDVPETCRLLAERMKAEADPADYAEGLRQLEELYLDQFLYTCLADPTFSDAVHAGIARFI